MALAVTKVLLFVSIFASTLAEFTLVIDDSTVPKLATWAQELESAIKQYYPMVVDYLASPGYTAPDTINIVIDGSCEGYIESGDNNYTVCGKDLSRNGPTQNDLNTVVQCTTWSAMSYPSPPVAPDWMTQCIAAVVRYYKWEPTVRPSKDTTNNSPKTSSSEGCGYFLNYVNKTYPQSPDVVQRLSQSMRQGTYLDLDFVTITGKTGKQLWKDMQAHG